MSDPLSENLTDKSVDYQNGHQDIRLTEGSPNLGIINPLNSTGGTAEGNNKRTWVKFDDETDEKINTTENVLSNALSATVPSTIQTTPATTTPTTTTSLGANKLSPPPPSQRNLAKTTPAVQQRQRSPSSTIATPITTTRSKSPAQNTSVITSDITPAVLNTESTHVNLNNPSTTPEKPSSSNSITNSTKNTSNNAASSTVAKNEVSIPISSTMRTIELSTGTIREGFANGDVIVTLLPCNTKWPWITPAIFRPELVPEELMAQGLTLTVEEYVNAMETLVNDYRFTMYNICYKRILVCWIIFAFCVLMTLLFSGLQKVALFSLGVGWLFFNAAAIFFCMWMKLRLSRGLEKCLARVNKQLIKHKILLVLDDRGKISCHKVNLCFLYFDSTQCVTFLNSFLEQTEQNGHNIQSGWESKLDLDINDIVIQGSNPMRLSRKQEIGWRLYLRYASRWGFDVLRGLQDVSPSQPGRHCAKYVCPCQYIVSHLKCKPEGKWKFFNTPNWAVESTHLE